MREAGGMVAEIDGGDMLQTGSIMAGNEDILPLIQKQLRHASAFGKAAAID